MVEGIKKIASSESEIQEAVDFIMEMRQQAGTMGANNWEVPPLNRLIESVQRGEISPLEAKQMAEKIRYSKQEYH